MKQAFFILSFFFLYFVPAFSQTDSLPGQKRVMYDTLARAQATHFDTNKIEDYKSQHDFSYIKKVEDVSWWTLFKRWISKKYQSFLSWLFGNYKASPFLRIFFKILPFLILALLLGFAVWLFIRLNPAQSFLEPPKKPLVFRSEEEEIVHSKNIHNLIEEALQNNQYRLAVRYYYLEVLRKLDELEIISYQFQKTNEDYASEIKRAELKKQFNAITRLYNFIWYGDFKLSEEGFLIAKKGFLEMDNELKKPANE